MQPAPPCGNYVLDPEEVCDDGNTDDGDACAQDCKEKRALLVFISSIKFSGDIQAKTPIPNDPYPTSGIGNAAVACARMAKAALDAPNSTNTLLKWSVTAEDYPHIEKEGNTVLQSQFLPWLSNEFFSPDDAYDRDCGLPYLLTDGKTIVAKTFDDIIETDQNFVKINKLENGNIAPSRAVWTNTDDRGKIAWDNNGGHCDNWTTSEIPHTGNRGEYSDSADHEWTIKGVFQLCNNLKRIYCFEQCPSMN